MDSDPNLGSTGEHGHSGDKRRQAFLWAELYVFVGPGVMAANQPRCFGGYVNGLWQESAVVAGEGGGGFCVWAALRWMVCESGWAGVAVLPVTSIWTRRGRMMSIPISTVGDSRPMITMTLALPLASPQWRFRCWAFPVIWRDLPCEPWTTPSKGFKGPHWVRYCHHTENPIQVTEAPVSTRPRTGMPSRLSWPVMGGPTTHPTAVPLASGDPSNSLTER